MFGAFALGGDVDDAAVDCAAANAAAAASSSRASRGVAALARWTVRRLPLRAGCADMVVTDLPFGVHCKAKGVNRNGLYAWVANEVCSGVRGKSLCSCCFQGHWLLHCWGGKNEPRCCGSKCK